MISEPALTGPAGGGQMMAHTAAGESCLYDFFVNTPRAAADDDTDFFKVTVHFASANQDFHIGRGSVAVPGTAAGLLRVHSDLGRLLLGDVIKPACRLAVEGVALAPVQAQFLDLLAPILTRESAGRALYAPTGRTLAAGEQFRNPMLAATLKELVKEGAGLFYEGEIGGRLAAWAGRGGLVLQQDLQAYRVVCREPLRAHFRGCTLLLNPPPAKNGAKIGTILGQLSTLPEPALAHVVSALAQTHPDVRAADAGSTTHLSVLDRQGNAASVTTTNGEGCGFLLPETGVMPNNMLGEEELNPDGFLRGRPGVRLATAIAPTIALRNGEPVLLTGSAGSERILSALAQVMFRHLYGGETIAAATEAPRAHLEGSTLHVEPGLGEELLSGLDDSFTLHKWPAPSVFFGGVNSVTPTEAVADSRRGGCALVVSD